MKNKPVRIGKHWNIPDFVRKPMGGAGKCTAVIGGRIPDESIELQPGYKDFAGSSEIGIVFIERHKNRIFSETGCYRKLFLSDRVIGIFSGHRPETRQLRGRGRVGAEYIFRKRCP